MLMMKQLLLTLALLAGLSAQAQSDYRLSWAHTLDSNPAGGDNALQLDKAADGNYFYLNVWGSCEAGVQPGTMYQNAPDDFMHYYIDGKRATDDRGGEITGSLYLASEGTSYNENVALQKFDADGNILWIVWSDRGSVLNSYTHVAPTKDGGALLLLYARHWAQDAATTLIRLNGTKGSQVTLLTDEGTWEAADGTSHRYFVPVLARISADGEVLWAKTLFGVEPQRDLKYSPAWLSFLSDMALDDEENVYICGNYRTTLSFTRADGSTETHTARNTQGWTGDDQSGVGDLYLAKFDSEGRFLKFFEAEGTATQTQLNLLTIHDGTVYTMGHVVGDGTPLTIGSNAITAAQTGQSLLVAALDTDLTPRYARVYNDNGNGRALHLNGLQWLDDALYLTGSYLNNAGGALVDADGTSVLATNTRMHEGYILKLNPADGSVLATGINDNKNGISKYTGVFKTVGADGQATLNAFGYEFNTGAIIANFTESETDRTLTKNGAVTVMSRGETAPNIGTIAVTVVPVVEKGRVLLANRFGKANTANFTTTFYGGQQTTPVNCWSTALYALEGDDIVGEPQDDNAQGINSPTRVYTAGTAAYDPSGRRMASGQAWRRGLYIVQGKKLYVK